MTDAVLLIAVLLAIGAWCWAFDICGQIRHIRRQTVGGHCAECDYECGSLIGHVKACPECGADMRRTLPIDHQVFERGDYPEYTSGVFRTLVLSGLPFNLCCMIPDFWGTALLWTSVLPAQVLIAIFLYVTRRRLTGGESLFCVAWAYLISACCALAALAIDESKGVVASWTFGGFGFLASAALVRQYRAIQLEARLRQYERQLESNTRLQRDPSGGSQALLGVADAIRRE